MLKLFYLELFIPVIDYFKTIRLKESIFEWVFPAISCYFIYKNLGKNICLQSTINFSGYIINFLAIFIGFSIASITILASGGSKNIRRMENIKTHRKVRGTEINLFQLMHITFYYLLFVEIVALIVALSYSLYFDAHKFLNSFRLPFLLQIFLILHIMLLTFRNLTNFYFALFPRSDQDEIL